MYRVPAALLCAAGLCAQIPSSPQKNTLEFEVASIKPSRDDSRGPFGIRPAPGGESYLASHVTLKVLITVAYRIRPDQVIGGPGWIDTDFYDMIAKADRPSSVEQLHLMLQSLLADRFKLRFHRAAKEMPVYALTVDKGGPKLKPDDPKSAGDPWIDASAEHFPQMTWHAKFASMDFFAWRLSTLMDRPVVNRTNLKGGYDFDLSFPMQLPSGPDSGAGAPVTVPPPVPPGPEIPAFIDAFRAQLGLNLERQKGPVDTLVIDHAEKPAEN